QAAYGIFEVFVDSLVVCVVTGLVVLSTGAWQSGADAAVLSANAFATGLPGNWGHLAVTISLVTFAFSTIIGWAYYGETAITYLLGTGMQLPYRLLWIAVVFIGAVTELRFVWEFSETFNGLMAFPNLIGVLGSLGLLMKLVREFFAEKR
ncbi:MAG: alanine:cation symporter family protein, partial [bacterium]|nr:alanine:cation symporter family protein [bacterium]